MSGAGPFTRGYGTPRWSYMRLNTLLPWSMSRLPDSTAWVRVGPPLKASGPRPGVSEKIVSAGSDTEVLPTRLWLPVTKLAWLGKSPTSCGPSGASQALAEATVLSMRMPKVKTAPQQVSVVASWLAVTVLLKSLPVVDTNASALTW